MAENLGLVLYRKLSNRVEDSSCSSFQEASNNNGLCRQVCLCTTKFDQYRLSEKEVFSSSDTNQGNRIWL